MKKVKLLGMILSVMFLWIIGQPLEVRAEYYCWQELDGVVGWYRSENDTYTYMDNAPENLTEADSFNIYTSPDEECTQYLINLTGCFENVQVYGIGVDSVQIGKAGAELKIGALSAGANSIIYADVEDVYDIGNCTVNGDVETLYLGSYFVAEHNDFNVARGGTININGNLQKVQWIKDREDVNECCFIGNVCVSGTVTGGEIIQVFYDDVIEENVFATSGTIGQCAAGTFVITDGVLSDEVPVVEKEPSVGEYYHFYTCDNDYWTKGYYNKETYQYATSEGCTLEDIPNMAQVYVVKATQPIVFNTDLGFLQVNKGNVTVNGDIVSGEPGVSAEGYLTIVPGTSGAHTVVINGDVETANVLYNYNPEANVTITGKVINGEYKNSLTGETLFFECENVQLIKDGVWNENVLLKTSLNDDAISFEVVDEETVADAVGDETIGQEVVDGETTIVKSVGATLEQTAQAVIDLITETDSFKDVLDAIIEKLEETVEAAFEAKAVCAVDISIDSYYREKESGNVYTANPTYGKENISELPEGKKLEFSVKIPKNHYKENSKYTIVRQHENADGSVAMEQIETTQNGDMLTFASDKFSTFVIVEVGEKTDTTVMVVNTNGDIVKEEGMFGDGTYNVSGLTAGTYTLIVFRENYVTRTYTVEVETDLEIVEIDVKLHKLGDITGDDTINARDKKMLYNHIAGTAILEDYDLAVGDVTGDGTLNARDKKMVFNHIAGTSSLWE